MKILLSLFAALAPLPPRVAPASEVRVTVDPRIELLAVVEYLSGYGAAPNLITRCEVDYKGEVDTRLGEFRSHRAVKLFDTMSRHGFAFDAPVAAVLHYGPPPELAPLSPMDESIASRAGSKEAIDEFVQALREFARDARFMPFFEAQKPLFDSMVAEGRASLEGIDVNMLERYYGETRASYTIVLAPLFHPGGFGPRVRRADGSLDVYSVQGPYSASAGRPSFGAQKEFRYLVWHEFSHSFVNPLVDRFADRVDATDVLFAPLHDRMRAQSYGTWRICVYEHIVRACTVRFAARELGPEDEKAWMDGEIAHSFVHAPELARALETYERDRASYPTLADYFPELIGVFERAAQDAEKDPAARRPHVVRSVPEAGAKSVDPALGEIVVEFDCDMNPASFAWVRGGAGEFPERTGTPRYVNARTCALPVKLAPGRSYWIGINASGLVGFESKSGRPAEEFVLQFTTADR